MVRRAGRQSHRTVIAEWQVDRAIGVDRLVAAVRGRGIAGCLAQFWLHRQDVDRAARRIAAIKRALRTLEDLDPLQIVKYARRRRRPANVNAVVVECDSRIAGGHYGEVADITLRTTKIRTLDNTYISIPNSVITSSPVINYSEQGKLRITAHVSIGYNESVEDARTALITAVSSIKGVLKSPAPAVVVKELGESSVHLLVRVWVSEPGFEQRYFFLLTEMCKKALDDANISIPFPQHDVHLISSAKKVLKRKKH